MEVEGLLGRFDLGDDSSDLMHWARGRADKLLAEVNPQGQDLHLVSHRVLGQLAEEVGLGEGPAQLSVPPPAPPPRYPAPSHHSGVEQVYDEPESLEFGIPDDFEEPELLEDVYTDIVQPRTLHESVELAVASSLKFEKVEEQARPERDGLAPRARHNTVASLDFLHDDEDD
ncbi:MAG: hypothetical protein ACPG4T_04985 [Nannocystaceae bacterium]